MKSTPVKNEKDLFNPDRSGWEIVKFGDVVTEVKNTSPRSNDEIQYVIGLDHIDPLDIHIRRWDSPDKGTTFTRQFKKGQVLFGRRRAYQRKAALAEFDGICSGDIIVMEAKPEMLEPSLLPFLVHSEAFYRWAVSTSAGSLSPRTKFKHLAEFEFKLPPLSVQKEISDLLKSMDSLEEKYSGKVLSLERLYQVTIENYFSNNDDWQKIKLKNVAEINKKSLTQKTDPSYEFSYLDIASIAGPKKLGNLNRTTFREAPSRARRIVNDGDIVMSLVRPYHRAFVLIDEAENLVSSTGTAVVTVDSAKVLNSFVFHQFFTKRFLRYCENRMTGTNYPAITPGDLADFVLFIPNEFKLQEKVAQELNLIDKVIEETIFTQNKLNMAKFSIINNVFS